MQTQIQEPQDWLAMMAQMHLLTIASQQEEQGLRSKSHTVTVFGKELNLFCQAMVEQMRKQNGIGLAAPQMGILQRVFVAQTDEKKPPLVVINPIIQPVSAAKKVGEEGCLSIPGIYADVARWPKIDIIGQNPYGKKFTLQLEGINSICCQHENDHLEGILFIDYLSRSQQKKIKKHFAERNEKDSIS